MNPALMQPAIPRRGLVCWHRLKFDNILLQSNKFDTAWSAFRAAVVQAAATYSPSGSLAWKLVADNTPANSHLLAQSYTFQASPYKFSVWAKGAERTWLRVQLYDGTTYSSCYFNLSTGAVASTANCTGSAVAQGTGYRCTIFDTGMLPAAGSVAVFIAEGDGDNIFDGTGSAPYTEDDPGLYIADAQLYPSASLPPYKSTTTLQSGELGLIDLSGHGYHLQRGATTGAEASDPTVLGLGISLATDDYAKVAAALPITKSGPFTILFAGKPSGSTGTLFSLTDNATASTKFQRVAYSASTAIQIGSAAGGAESLSDALTVSATAYQFLALVSDGTTLTLKRLDTGTSVTVADTDPDGNAYLGIGATIGSSAANIADALIALCCLPYSRALSNAEIQRIYREVKRWWGQHGVTIL